MVLSEEEVRKSFARVKADILQVKRSLNKQLFSIESMGKTLPGVLPKDEFYTFVQRLGSKVEEIENNFVSKPDKDDVDELVSELHNEISAVRKMIERREDLSDELRQVRALKGKVLELEGIAVPKPEFSKELAKLKADLSGLKSASSGGSNKLASLASSVSGLEKAHSAMTGELSSFKSAAEKGGTELSSLFSSLSKLEKSLTALASKFNSLSAAVVMKEDIASFTERIESSHQESLRGFSSLKREVDRKAADVEKRVAFIDSVEEKLSSLGGKLSETENALAGLNEAASKKFVDKRAFEKATGELGSKLNETRQVLESSISEVNIEDYVTKRSLKNQLASLSESLNSTLSDSVSSKISEVEARLASMKKDFDSALDNADRQLGREMQKFAPSRELKKLREELDNISLSLQNLVPLDEFSSRIEKLHDASADAAGDFKKEIRRQREMFEEKLKSLESYYRSSNETIRSELEQVRSQIKGLTKADAEAKSEIAKVSVSATKAAAKTATEILEEIETESGSRRRGKGLSPLVVAIIIVVLLVAGSAAYVIFKGPGEVETVDKTLPPAVNLSVQLPLNETTPNNISELPANVSVANISANVSPAMPPIILNVSKIQVNATVNVTANATVKTNVSVTAANLTVNVSPANASSINKSGKSANISQNQACKKKLECTKRAGKEYWFDCYFDNSLQDCRCFVGTIANCPWMEANGTGNETGKNASAELEGEGKSPGAKYYGVVAFVILVVAFFAYKALFVREDKEGHAEKAEQKPEKPKAQSKPEAKDAGKSGDGEGVIDLEEFFEKKEPKKK